MNAHELQEIQRLHGMWLRGEEGGRQADLHCVDLARADLRGATFFRTMLPYADLTGANLSHVSFRDSDLRGAMLNGATLQGTIFHRTDLRGANLSGTAVHGVYLNGANLRGAQLPAPTAVLLAWWGDLSDDLTALAMAYNASCHPDPSAFTRWADGGPCPYAGVSIQRACNFRERFTCWDPYLPTPRPYDLMVEIIREKCADSDFHTGGAK